MPMTDKHQKLLRIIKEAIQLDQELRVANEVGDKFCFIRDRLTKLCEQIETNIKMKNQQETELSKTHSADSEILVYVYLFNAHGLDLRSWAKMLSPKGFDEYSVNRPIYLDKTHAESVIKNKSNKAQHAYLIVALANKDLIQSEGGKDALGHSLAKIREGSLKFEKLISFIHNEHVYVVNAEEGLVKK